MRIFLWLGPPHSKRLVAAMMARWQWVFVVFLDLLVGQTYDMIWGLVLTGNMGPDKPASSFLFLIVRRLTVAFLSPYLLCEKVSVVLQGFLARCSRIQIPVQSVPYTYSFWCHLHPWWHFINLLSFQSGNGVDCSVFLIHVRFVKRMKEPV